MNIAIENGFPENHGLSSKSVLRCMEQIERLNLAVNSFMLLQDGKTTARFWRKPYREDCQQLLFSLSKSFTSIAIGIAWDNGYLDLHDRVTSFFPEKLPEIVPVNLASMTIHHLLSMNTGHRENIYNDVVSRRDWVKAFLSLDVEHEPGSHYRYSTPATYMLSAIVERATGENMFQFLTQRLFEPLGIPHPSWETCPLGIVAGGMGLSITTEAIARFGQMLLDKGVYGGKRIVSQAYIELATREQSDNRQDEDKIDWAQGYGYQFFLCRRGCFMGNGAFGQLCFVAPEQRIVIAATSSFTSMKQLQTLLDVIFEHIIDRVNRDSPLRLEDNYVLEQHLADRTYGHLALQPIPEDIPNLQRVSYIMDDNPHHVQTIHLSLIGEELEFQLVQGDGGRKLYLFDFTKPVHIQDVFIKDLALHRQEVVTSAIWQDRTTLELTLSYIETPYVVTYTIIFKDKDKAIELQFRINVSFHMEPYSVTGKYFGS